MQRFGTFSLMAAIVVFAGLVLLGGCYGEPSVEPRTQPGQGPVTNANGPSDPTQPGEMPATPPAPATINEPGNGPVEQPTFNGEVVLGGVPEVVLDQTLAKTCLLGVGDAIPEGALEDPAGTSYEISTQLGPKLTVLFFWETGRISSLQLLKDFDKDRMDSLAARGVSVIGINEKDSPEAIQDGLESTQSQVPVLLDPDGEYFALLATEMLPRIYLLDKEGKIVWFDVEYSEETRRNLNHAIDVLLGDG